MSAVVVRAAGLSKAFGSTSTTRVQAVHGVDLEVVAGETRLIVGPSGSGKTTLLSMMGCLTRPSGGRLFVGDLEATASGPRELAAIRRDAFGFVFQRHHLIDDLTVAENVEVPLNLAGRRRPGSRERALRLLEELGLASRADARPGVLSGGESQRAAVARALATDPRAILADEPTGSLDDDAGEIVLGMLRAAATERGKAVLIVSHDARVRRYADRTFRMENGALVSVE